VTRTAHAPRPISDAERDVLKRAFSVCATEAATPAHLSAIDSLIVASTCECGCDTVEFAGRDAAPPPTPSILADGLAEAPSGAAIGLIVFGTPDAITCLEVYSFDDEPARLPAVATIRPFEQAGGLSSNPSLERP